MRKKAKREQQITSKGLPVYSVEHAQQHSREWAMADPEGQGALLNAVSRDRSVWKEAKTVVVGINACTRLLKTSPCEMLVLCKSVHPASLLMHFQSMACLRRVPVLALSCSSVALGAAFGITNVAAFAFKTGSDTPTALGLLLQARIPEVPWVHTEKLPEDGPPTTPISQPKAPRTEAGTTTAVAAGAASFASTPPSVAASTPTTTLTSTSLNKPQTEPTIIAKSQNKKRKKRSAHPPQR